MEVALETHMLRIRDNEAEVMKALGASHASLARDFGS